MVLKKLQQGFLFPLLVSLMVTVLAAFLPLFAAAAERGDMANSFRYQDGQELPSVSLFSTDTSDAWQKVDGHYYSSDGSVIEGATAKGIDVSYSQGEIDWAAAKADGVEFAILRCGYGMDQTNQDDSQWVNNVAGCEANDIPYGVYLYSYATTVEKAKSEAAHVLRLLKGHTLSYPVYYDLEDTSILNNTTAEERTQIATAFTSAIKAAGYEVGIYANKNWFENYLPDATFKQWGRWVAQWGSKCTYAGTYQLWQATNAGTVDGIKGAVDIDFVIAGHGQPQPADNTATTAKKTETTTAAKKNTAATATSKKKTTVRIGKTPKITVKASGKRKVRIRWKPKASGLTCTIYYSTKKAKGYKKYAAVSAKKGQYLAKKKLKSKKKYYFKARFSKKSKSRTIYGKYSGVKAVKVK